MNSIPSEDRKKIEHLFEYLFWDQQFIYSLFGSKPMSTAGWNKEHLFYGLLYPNLASQMKYYWKIWEKYKNQFTYSNYVLLANESDNYFEVYLLNKSLIQKIVMANLVLFERKLGAKINNHICQRLSTSKQILNDALNASQTLYGILLGYGTINSSKFEQYYSANNCFLCLPPDQPHQEEIPYRLALPYFVSFSPQETKQLNKTYSIDRERIMKLLDNKNFLEVILEQLTMIVDENKNSK